ncbi:D-alanyl-D-alanine carboxypeptidase DacB precursor [Pelotomaculum sp. FP]|uniref:D-alanyl-D-alanine carboxypeptidase family protein n=1 Tax=Pelotomaculum sp. FP TaxID=261474 RepID=UPI001064DD0D|nr:D-alanyl-D-alanine carboxypeptidase family protein [Pelotomaculum sp. FP]TEB18014.1 D-alanyl-D-alanine carboxypeptidase DacB precursor [Pelotomaculum sp. FP]
MQTKTGLCTILAVIIMLLFHSPRPAVAVPEISGEAAALIDGRNGQFLYEKNPYQQLYPASTTKILTAVIALENSKLNDMVTITAEACNVEGSALGLLEGEKMSLEDLLYALMLNSGNDAAVAIAVHVAGSVEKFADLMNEKAAEVGAVNSHFINPNGLPDPNHYSTAHDMALISYYAMQNPEFRKIVATKIRTIDRGDPMAQTYLENHNRLLWNYEGAVGIKNGYTEIARQCLVSAANRNGRELVAVVLKTEGANIWTDSQTLLDYGFNDYNNICLTEAGKFVGEVPVRYGLDESVPVQTGCSLNYNFPTDNTADFRPEVKLAANVNAPVKAGTKLGELVFFEGDRELGRVDLIAQKQVDRKLLVQICPWLIAAPVLALLLVIVRLHNNARRRRWKRYKQKYYLSQDNQSLR